MLERERRMSTPPVTGPLISGEPKKRAGLDFRVYLDLKIGIHRELLNHLNLEKVATQPDDHVRRQVFASIQGVAANLKTPPSAPELTPTEKEQLLFEVLGEVFRLGPLEPLLQDPTISDILVNGAQEVYIERAGVLEESRTIFKDNIHLMHIIDKIVSAVGRRVDESSPMVAPDSPTDLASTWSFLRPRSTVHIFPYGASGTSQSPIAICWPHRR